MTKKKRIWRCQTPLPRRMSWGHARKAVCGTGADMPKHWDVATEGRNSNSKDYEIDESGSNTTFEIEAGDGGEGDDTQVLVESLCFFFSPPLARRNQNLGK